MRSETVDLAIDRGLATLTLNRPDVGNAINLDLARSLLTLAIRCDTDPEVRCVVVTGSGRLFCAGGDIGFLSGAGERLPAVISELITLLHAAIARLARMNKPLLVLVNGPAAGAGFSLAMLGDIVLASRLAHFTAAYSAIGLTADGGLSWLLPRLVGLRRAQELILTNRRVSADEGEAMGLITRAVDDDALSREGAAMAARLASAPVFALGATRALLAECFTSGLECQLEREQRSMIVAGNGEAQEGLSAFLAKRQPDFRRG